MKKIFFLILTIIFLSPIKNKSQILGDKPPTKFKQFFWSKHHKKCLRQRDSLLVVATILHKDTSLLHKMIRERDSSLSSLIKSYDELNKSYKALANSSDKQLSELMNSLQQKTKQIEEREKSLVEKDKQLKEMQAILKRQDSILKALNNTVKNALLGLKSDEFGVEMKNGKVYVSLSDKLLFKSGQATVETAGQEAIKKLATVLAKNPDIDIAVEGHTDSIPIKTASYQDNWDLSVARSTNIVRMLTVDLGIDAKRVTASGRGEFVPVGNNSTPEGRAKNRRTEIVLSPKLEQLFKFLGEGK